MAETVLVTGATGHTGGPLVDLLVPRGTDVRVMLRRGADAARFQGAAVALADLDDDRSVAAALEGVDRAYLVTPSSERAEAQQLRFAELAASAGVRQTEPGHEGRTYAITGPEAVTHAQMASAIGAAVGKDVAFVDVPPEAFAGALKGMLPEWQLSGLLEDYAHYARGEASEVTATVKEITGRPARDFVGFARENAAAFGGASS